MFAASACHMGIWPWCLRQAFVPEFSVLFQFPPQAIATSLVLKSEAPRVTGPARVSSGLLLATQLAVRFLDISWILGGHDSKLL